MKSQTGKILIPLMPGCDHTGLLRLAAVLSESKQVCLVGIVPVDAGQSLSAGANSVRQLRQLIMQSVIGAKNINMLGRVRVTRSAWEDLRGIIAEEKIDLLLLSYPTALQNLELTSAEILAHPPCDIGLVCGPVPQVIEKVVVPMQDSMQAKRSFDLASTLVKEKQAKLTALCFDSRSRDVVQEISKNGQIDCVQAGSPNQADAMIQAAQKHDLLIMNTAQRPTAMTDSFGVIPDYVLNHAACGVICLKLKEQEIVLHSDPSAVAQQVDRWFAENTFHADEYLQLEQLLLAKKSKNLTVSVALPALNEAETIGTVIEQIQEHLMNRMPLIDELVIIDSNSTDETREIARSYGVPVYIHQELLTDYGMRDGKGEALWKSLYVTTGDIVLWCDTDIKNFHPRFIYGLLGPLLQSESIQFVKGFYQRPINDGNEKKKGGGRVTELTARPLLNMFFPELAGFVQPLAGEYGGRRELLEQLAFTSGYGVETSILIDALEKAGLEQLAQVDLIERVHHNQPLESLSKMSFAVTQAIFQRLEQQHGRTEFKALNRLLNLSMRRIQQEGEQMHLDHEALAEPQRPPMNTIPAYRDRYKFAEMPLTGIKAGNLLRDVLRHPDDVFLIPGKLASRS